MNLRAYINSSSAEDLKLLENSRECLNKMKGLFFEDNLEYKDYPIFNYTEAELEYYEALFFYNNDEIPSASIKILHATNRAYRVKEKQTKMDKSFTHIIPLIDDLRIKIFKKMNII
jgi:hypothetical protein